MTDWPDVLNAYQFFLGDRLEAGQGDSIAIRTDSRMLTFDEVDALTAGFATALSERDVRRGDRVLLMMSDGPEFVSTLFAAMRLGAVVVMVNPGLKEGSLGPIVDRSRAKVAVVEEAHRSHLESSLREWEPTFLDPAAVGPADHRRAPESTSPADPAIWLFSGGTTGVPKTVPQSHRSLVNTTRLYGQQTLGLTADDITMSVPKLYFGYATGSNLLFPFSVGASTVLFAEHPTPAVLFDRIEKHRPTVLVNVPSAINQMLAHPGAESRDTSSLRLATSAGEALPETLYHRWKATFGVELLDGLGTAEMWHIFISNRIDDTRPGTLGKVVPGFEISARDEEGHDVPAGDVGRLWVRGDSLGLGYVDDPEQTEESFRGDWFVGGDLVSIDEEGYVTHRGRADDAIKVKGKWFRPQEVESVLLGHDSVKECAVVAVEDESGLARPVAFVVPGGSVTEGTLTEWVLERLEAYKHPRRVYFVEELPQTHLGKVDRGALKRQAV